MTPTYGISMLGVSQHVLQEKSHLLLRLLVEYLVPTGAVVGHELSESNWRKTSSISVIWLVFDGSLKDDGA